MSGGGRIGKSDLLAIAKQRGAGSGGSAREPDLPPMRIAIACLADRFGLIGDGFLSEQLFPSGSPRETHRELIHGGPHEGTLGDAADEIRTAAIRERAAMLAEGCAVARLDLTCSEMRGGDGTAAPASDDWHSLASLCAGPARPARFLPTRKPQAQRPSA